MNLEGLSSVCAKLEPASSKNNEILEIMSCKNLHCMLSLYSVQWVLVPVMSQFNRMDDTAKGSLTQFWELFTRDSFARPKTLNINRIVI